MRKLAWLAVLGGCGLYFGNGNGSGGGGGGSCPPGVTGIYATQVDLLDPSSGQCKTFATGCDSQCGPCHAVDLPAWPQCDGACTGLSESACIANPQCHPAYLDTTEGSGSASRAFSACWNITATPSDHPNACDGLDPDTCAAQHDCASMMLVATDVEHYEYCFALHNASCQDPGICYGTVQCNDAPPPCPTGTVAGITNGCWSGYCIPTTKCPD